MNSKAKYKKIVNIILLISWMCFIFYMSNQPAEISNVQSGFVLSVFSYIGINLSSVFGQLTMTVIRKGGHLSEYLILFFLVYRIFNDNIKNKKIYLLCLLIVFLYACTDEIHQLFISGRAGRITDVMIDSMGAILGIIVIEIKNRLKKKS